MYKSNDTLLMFMWLPLFYATLCAIGYKFLIESSYYKKELNKMFEYVPHKKYIYIFVGKNKGIDYLTQFFRLTGVLALVWAILYAGVFSLLLGHIK